MGQFTPRISPTNTRFTPHNEVSRPQPKIREKLWTVLHAYNLFDLAMFVKCDGETLCRVVKRSRSRVETLGT